MSGATICAENLFSKTAASITTGAGRRRRCETLRDELRGWGSLTGPGQTGRRCGGFCINHITSANVSKALSRFEK